MITLLTGLPIWIYSLYYIINYDKFSVRMHCASIEYTIDASMILYMAIWFVVQFFFQSGVIALLPLFAGLVISDFTKSRRKNSIKSLSFLITTNAATNFIILNELILNLNFWGN